MSADDKYFQFPLALLAYSGGWPEPLDAIFAYCVQKACEAAGGNVGFRRQQAQKKLAITVGDWGATERCYDKAESFLRYVPYTGSGDCLVRLKAVFYWESRKGVGLDERELKVLCAIYSAIGEHPMRRITLDEIQRRAAGCVSRALYEKWQGRGTVYTSKQIRSTVNDLHVRSLFARATYGCRLTYYSHRLDPAGLGSAIFAKHTKSVAAARTRSTEDAALTERINRMRGQLKGN